MGSPDQVKILVVDDSEANRLLLSFMLEELEFDCDEAEDGEKAVELAMEFDYVAVFMDLNMPLINGIEATEILRSLNFEQPIFACSAEDNSEKIKQLLNSGFNDFVAKPIEPDVISNILAKHAINKELVSSVNNSAYQQKLEQLSNRFIENLPVMITKIELSLKNNSLSELKRSAHKLKGTASQFGFNKVAMIGRDIESAINKSKLSVALDKTAFLISELKKIEKKNRI